MTRSSQDMCMTPTTKCSHLIIYELRLCLIIESSSISTMCCVVFDAVYIFTFQKKIHIVISYFRYHNHQSAIGQCYVVWLLLFIIRHQHTKHTKISSCKTKSHGIITIFYSFRWLYLLSSIERISWGIGQFGDLVYDDFTI